MTSLAMTSIPLPSSPYRGIESFRCVDQPLFFARDQETRTLLRYVTIYRGVLFYGGSGAGKSSLINAGLIPLSITEDFVPEKLRVQPRPSEEIIVERISLSPDGGAPYLPSILVDAQDSARQAVLSTQAIKNQLRGLTKANRCPLLIFDQFEELVTLFDEAPRGVALEQAREAQAAILRLLSELLRDQSLPIKLLFVFREDYLAKLMKLLAQFPDLRDQHVYLTPPSTKALYGIIRGPFDKFPGHFSKELSPDLAQRLEAAIAERSESGALNLSEVQIVCFQLWETSDPDRQFREKGVQGLLEDYLSAALNRFTADLHEPAIALLGRMVTPSGTRNIIAEEELIDRVNKEEGIAPDLLKRSLEALERETRLVRRELRYGGYFYEIESEFLIPWISQQKLARERQRAAIKAGIEAEAQFNQWLIRARLRILAIGVTICTPLLLITALSVFHQWRVTNDIARSSDLATQARYALTIDPERSVQLAASAVRAAESTDFTDAIAQALTGSTGRANAIAQTDVVLRQTILASHLNAVLATTHNGPMLDAAFSADGTRAVTSSGAQNDPVMIWDLQSGRLLRRLHGIKRQVKGAAFSPDGRCVVTADADGTAQIWDVRTGSLLRTLPGHQGVVYSAAFSPDGRRVVTAGADGTAKIWEARTGRLLRSWQAHQGIVYSAAFSPDGRLLITAGANGTAKIWAVQAQTDGPLQSLQGHTRAVYSAAFSPDGNYVITGSRDQTARLWEAKTGTLDAIFYGHTSAVEDVAFSKDGDFVVTASSDGTARVWEARPPYLGSLVSIMRERTSDADNASSTGVHRASFSPDGKFVMTSSADGTVRIWQPFSAHLLKILGGRISNAAFSPDGRRIVTAGADGMAKIWDAQTGSLLRVLSGHQGIVYSATFSPDGQRIVTAGADDTAKIWEAQTGSLLRALRGRKTPIYNAAFSPDGRRIVTAGADGTAKIWEARTGRLLHSWQAHRGMVYSATFSPDGRCVVTAGADGMAKIWKAQTGSLLRALAGHQGMVYSATFSPDGQRIVTTSADGSARMWDSKTGRVVLSLNRKGPIFSAAFSPDGRLLITAGADGAVWVWDPSTGQSLVDLLGGQRQTVHSAVFPKSYSSAGQGQVVAVSGGTARIYSCDVCGSTAYLLTVASTLSQPLPLRWLIECNGRVELGLCRMPRS